MQKHWSNVVGALGCAVIMAVTLYLFLEPQAPAKPVTLVTNFEECQDAGYPIMETYPEQCRTPEGDVFVRIIDDIDDTANRAAFGSPQTMTIGDVVTFTDGLQISLIEINDSRCQPDVQCIWAGELAASFAVTNGSGSVSPSSIRLGTVNDQTVTIGKYTFTLVSATTMEVVITVTAVEEEVVPDPPLTFDSSLIPAGWYLHRFSDSGIMLSQLETLPEIGNTEGYAYGEQITIGTLHFTGDPAHIEDWNYIEWTKNSTFVHEKSWLTVQGLKAFRIQDEEGGASGGSLTYYLFDNDIVYTLSLTSTHGAEFETLVQAFAKQVATAHN